MNAIWKKLVSGVLTAMMLLSLCPAGAFAESEEIDWTGAASVQTVEAAETTVYQEDGQASDPLGTAQLETTFRFVLEPEKSVVTTHEETETDENGEEVTRTHTHTEHPYHDWRAAVVVSFDRPVAENTIGLATRCDACSDGGVNGWHGFSDL